MIKRVNIINTHTHIYECAFPELILFQTIITHLNCQDLIHILTANECGKIVKFV